MWIGVPYQTSIIEPNEPNSNQICFIQRVINESFEIEKAKIDNISGSGLLQTCSNSLFMISKFINTKLPQQESIEEGTITGGEGDSERSKRQISDFGITYALHQVKRHCKQSIRKENIGDEELRKIIKEYWLNLEELPQIIKNLIKISKLESPPVPLASDNLYEISLKYGHNKGKLEVACGDESTNVTEKSKPKTKKVAANPRSHNINMRDNPAYIKETPGGVQLITNKIHDLLNCFDAEGVLLLESCNKNGYENSTECKLNPTEPGTLEAGDMVFCHLIGSTGDVAKYNGDVYIGRIKINDREGIEINFINYREEVNKDTGIKSHSYPIFSKKFRVLNAVKLYKIDDPLKILNFFKDLSDNDKKILGKIINRFGVDGVLEEKGSSHSELPKKSGQDLATPSRGGSSPGKGGSSRRTQRTPPKKGKKGGGYIKSIKKRKHTKNSKKKRNHSRMKRSRNKKSKNKRSRMKRNRSRMKKSGMKRKSSKNKKIKNKKSKNKYK